MLPYSDADVSFCLSLISRSLIQRTFVKMLVSSQALWKERTTSNKNKITCVNFWIRENRKKSDPTALSPIKKKSIANEITNYNALFYDFLPKMRLTSETWTEVNLPYLVGEKKLFPTWPIITSIILGTSLTAKPWVNRFQKQSCIALFMPITCV